MSQKSRTPDERLMIAFYQAAMESGDPFRELEVPGIANALGQKETAVKNIIKHLAQANFIKKIDYSRVYLTQHGCNFVLDLLEE
jgi:Mn-dependent DtxR family transcriptional regulator